VFFFFLQSTVFTKVILYTSDLHLSTTSKLQIIMVSSLIVRTRLGLAMAFVAVHRKTSQQRKYLRRACMLKPPPQDNMLQRDHLLHINGLMELIETPIPFPLPTRQITRSRRKEFALEVQFRNLYCLHASVSHVSVKYSLEFLSISLLGCDCNILEWLSFTN